jgi:hypothetical protein
MKHKQKDNTFVGQVISKQKITNFDETETNETHAQQNNTLLGQMIRKRIGFLLRHKQMIQEETNQLTHCWNRL